MKKLLLGILLVLLVFSVYAENNGFLVLSNLVNPTIAQGNTGAVTFTAANTNTTTGMNLVFTISPPVYNGNYLTVMQIPITVLGPSASQSFSFNVTTLQNSPIGPYLGTISVVDSYNPTNNATLSYTVTVQQSNPSLIISSGLDTDGNFLISGSDNSDLSKSFTLQNNGNVNLNSQIEILADSSAFTSSSKTITFKINGNTANLNTLYSLGTINAGSSPTVSITAHIPNNMDVDTYEGNLTIISDLGASVSFPLQVRVEPEVCSDGRRSDGNSVAFNAGNLGIDISKPDNGDDFKQGDSLDVSVNVDNEDNSNMDVVVKAILYDVTTDNEIASVESDSKSIDNDGGDEDFDLTLEVPYDQDLDSGDSYIMYIKAYEDGDEDQNCEYDGVDMDFKRDSHDVIIDSFIVTPTLASCGNLVNFNVNALNVGENDEDNVKITLTNTELGLSDTSNEFSLDDYNGNDNEATKSFTFTIPSDAEEQEYLIEARVYYDDQDESNSEFGTLTVSNCGAVVEEETTVNFAETTFSISPGGQLTIPVVVTNNQNTVKTYTIEFNPSGSWASQVTETLTVNPEQSSTAYLYVTTLTSTTGSQTGTVTVKLDGDTVDSASINANIQSTTGTGATPTGTGATGATTYKPTSEFWNSLTSNTVFWVIGDIILVILIILVLVLIFRKR